MCPSLEPSCRKPMARTSRTKTTKRRASATPRSPDKLADRIVDAALDEAAAVGWAALTLPGVAVRAKVTLGDVLGLAPTKLCLVMRYFDRVDRLTFGPVTTPNPQDSARDRLFEIIMRRFDALNRHRSGSRAIIGGVARDLAALAAVGLRLHRVMAAMLAAADISTDGLVGCLKIEGLKGVCFLALRAWLSDDNDDMSKTMAALDRALAQAERIARFLPTSRRTETADG